MDAESGHMVGVLAGLREFRTNSQQEAECAIACLLFALRVDACLVFAFLIFSSPCRQRRMQGDVLVFCRPITDQGPHPRIQGNDVKLASYVCALCADVVRMTCLQRSDLACRQCLISERFVKQGRSGPWPSRPASGPKRAAHALSEAKLGGAMVLRKICATMRRPRDCAPQGGGRL
jgi:hypothetical protein